MTIGQANQVPLGITLPLAIGYTEHTKLINILGDYKMTYQFSHTYNRGRELTDKEIYQIGVEREEKLAELKKAVINFYRDENTGEILTICTKCFQSNENLSDLTYIDKAGTWDECYLCDAQNVPASYHDEI